MSGTTTARSLRYPTSGDNIAPLETHFKNLADDTDAALAVRDVQVFTASGTWTKPTNAHTVWIRVQGPAGAGGGVIGAGSGQADGGGGGGGGYAESIVAASTLGATEAVVVGTGGAGVSGAIGNAGSAASTFHGISGGAGGGGGVQTATTGSVAATPGTGGTASGGNVVNVPGAPGGSGRVAAGVAILLSHGGKSVLGSGGATPAAAGPGAAGTGYGGGGSGAFATTVSKAGGAGTDGIVIVVTT